MNTRKKVEGFPVVPDSEFSLRMAAFKKVMAENKLDLVVAYANYIDPSVVRYYSDFFAINENGGLVIPLEGDPILCSGQACHEWSKFKSKIKDIRIMPEVGEVSGVEYEIDVLDFENLFTEIKSRYQIKKIGYIGELTFPHVIFAKIQKVFPDAEIINADKLHYQLRMKKTENELNCIRKAGEIITKTYEFSLGRLKQGMTELDVQADLMAEMLRLGGEDHTLSWAPMIPSGKAHTDLCMNRNFLKKLQEGEIINVDAGVLYEGYNAVICTPVVLGTVPDEYRKAIQIAWDAHRKVADGLVPGATAKALYKLYADFLTEKGYRQFSPYGSVHSLGMLECEPPFFSANKDVALVDGSVIAIDAYFANMPWGSFRIEDTYIVGKDGPELVTPFNEEYLKRYL
ncbi:MAG: aminopeptidase P family protein [Calditrichaeota bacterium]|nr:MAG: aminopeptidase P family protein [Calditrichota bacterium]